MEKQTLRLISNDGRGLTVGLLFIDAKGDITGKFDPENTGAAIWVKAAPLKPKQEVTALSQPAPRA